MKKINKNRNKDIGITLIALVITIIVLLILAGITIAQLSNNGLFQQTNIAKEKYKNSQDYEDEQIDSYSNEIDSYLEGYRNFDIKNIELDYSNKVDIKSYNSSSNVFTVPTGGIVMAAATGTTNQAGGSRIYVSGIGLWICGDGTSSAWGRDSYSQIVTKGTEIYFSMYSGSSLDVAYYVPFK